MIIFKVKQHIWFGFYNFILQSECLCVQLLSHYFPIASLVVDNPNLDKSGSQDSDVIDETDLITTYNSFRKQNPTRAWTAKGWLLILIMNNKSTENALAK